MQTKKYVNFHYFSLQKKKKKNWEKGLLDIFEHSATRPKMKEEFSLSLKPDTRE